RPEVVGKWWIPGMWTGGGETPSWLKSRRYALHHALVAGDLAYAAWHDGGLTVLDVGDPTRPKLLAHRNLTSWSRVPCQQAGAKSIVIRDRRARETPNLFRVIPSGGAAHRPPMFSYRGGWDQALRTILP